MAAGGGGGVDTGYFAIPIIPSFEGIESKINDGLNGKFGPAGRKAGHDLGKGVADGLNDSQAAIKAALDRYTTLYNKHADTIGKVRVEQAKLNDLQAKGATDTRVLAQTERLESAKRREVQALKNATEAQKAYDKAQKQTSQGHTESAHGLHGVAEGAEHLFGALTKTTGALGPMGGALSGVAGEAVGMGTSILAAGAAGGIAGAGVALFMQPLEKLIEIGPEAVEKVYEIGESFDEMRNKASFATGLTGDALQQLSASVENVAKKTPASISEIGGVATSVTRGLHITGRSLEEITEQITNLNVKTGEATNVRDLGKAFRGFGVDAEHQSEALDQLYTASTNTNQSVNDLIHSVTVGGAPLRELGLNFGQSAALMSAFENAGLNGEKMVTGLRKSVAEFAKEHKDIPKALHETVEQLVAFKKAGEDANGVELANKMFGAKTGVQFWDAIKSGALDLEALSGGLEGVTLHVNDMAEQTEDAGEKWQILKNNIEVAVQPFATKFFDLTESGLTDLEGWVSTHSSEVIGFFTKLTDVTLAFAQASLKSFGLVTTGLGNIAHSIGDVVSVFDKSAAMIADLTGDSDKAADFRRQADEAGNWGVSMEHAGDALAHTADDFGKFREQLRAGGAELAEAAKLSDGLGKSVTTLKADGENVTIEVKENTPEVREKLDGLHAHLVEIAGDPAHMKIVPDTPEAKAIIDAFIAEQNHQEIKPEVKPNLEPANEQMKNFLDVWSQAVITPGVNPTPQPDGGGGGSHPWVPGSGALPPGNPLTDPLHHARGGIDIWDSVAAFAAGGMPDRAVIQQPVGPGGLIQWAEPKTGGEAYIPLGNENRDRSQAIWLEVGKRIGMLSMEGGGIIAYDRAIQEAQAIGDGRNYDYGGTGPNFDCSGAQSDIYAVITGKPTGTRYFSTESDFAALGFKRGYMAGAFNIGVHHGGGGMNSHMAATLPNGVNFESGGSDNKTKYGRGAHGANDPQFEDHWFLAVAGNPAGGAAGGGGEGGGGGGFNAAGYYTGGGGGGAGGGAGGTPGVGPGGEAGHYEPEPEKVHEAEERLDDARKRVQVADQRVKDLKVTASKTERMSAENDLDKAKREVADDERKLAEAQQGKFKADKAGKGEGGKGEKGGGKGEGGFGKILGDAFTETLGLDGSTFPDIKNLGVVKLLKAIMGITYTPQGDGSFAGGLLAGAVPGGAAFGAGGGPGGGGGGDPISSLLGLPMGMIPSATTPGAPADGGLAPGMSGGADRQAFGALGNVDQSTNIHINNPQGTAKDIEAGVRKGIMQAPRLGTYEQPGLGG